MAKPVTEAASVTGWGEVTTAQAVTVQASWHAPEDLDAISDGVWLAGLALAGDTKPRLLAATWKPANNNGWLPVWGINLESAAGLKPELISEKSALTIGPPPEAGHTYETQLSYDPASGIASLCVTDLTVGQIGFAAQYRVQHASVPFSAAYVRSDMPAAGSSVIAEPDWQHIVAAYYLPVAMSMRVTAKPENRLAQLNVNRINRAIPNTLEIASGDAPMGEIRVFAAKDGQKTELATVPAQAPLRIALDAGKLPVGDMVLTAEYANDGHVWVSRSLPIAVGIVQAALHDTSLDTQNHQLTGTLALIADGPIASANAKATATISIGSNGGQRQTLSVPLLNKGLALAGGETQLAFSAAVPTLQDNASVSATISTTVAVPTGVLMEGADSITLRHYPSNVSLKDTYSDRFLIGIAKDSVPRNLQEMVVRNFNIMTDENALKWSLVHPTPTYYNFAVPDAMVAFATQHNMQVVGHCLIWHNSVPDWVFQDVNGKPVSREELLRRMEEHIKTVVGHYRGKVRGWDVVNEALDAEGGWRDTPWYRILGEEYIVKAFEWAHEADPNAELYYNDYNLEDPLKLQGVVRIVEMLQKRGIRIDAVGDQGHWSLRSPSVAQIDATIKRLAALGVHVNISELDISMQSALVSAGAKSLTPQLEHQQAQRYKELFDTFSKNSAVIDRVTFWGITDNDSWLHYKYSGADFPLLFDGAGNYKEAYQAILE